MRLAEWSAYARLELDVVGASGNELELADGRRLLDLYGGHCVNTLGSGDAELGRRLAAQWNELSFATNLLDLEPRRAFLRAFEANLPEGEWVVFCSNSGAEANENALKSSLAATGRSRVVCFGGAFHGRTAGATSITDTENLGFPAAPFEVARVPFGDARAAQDAIDDTVAAVVLEPIQSLAGVVEPPPGYLEGLRAACDTAGAALVFDEVQTGNGRLGTPWASQYYGVLPDLFTTAKGAGGGLPIGLTVARAAHAARVPGGLFGSTFGGGPLALTAATEVARRIAAPAFLENVWATGAALREASVRGPVRAVRGAGLLLGLELHPGHDARSVRNALLERGVLVGTCNDPGVVRLSPALTLRPEQAQVLAAALGDLGDSGSSGSK